jgi:hypothetical protein
VPDISAGSAGGLFIAGANAATSITTALTANVIGNITGNLSGSVGSVTGAVGSVTGAVGSVTGSVGSVTGAVGSVTGAVGSVVGLTAATVHADLDDIQARLPAALTAGGNIKADVDTIKTNPVVNAGTLTFPTNETLASTVNITAGTVTTSTNVTTVNGLAANVITAASMAADASAEIADAVWDEPIAGHLGAGSTGLALNSAGAAGDPWSTALPGAYGAGTAGKIVGDNIDAPSSTILSKLLKYTQLLARKDAAIATDNAVELTAINADGGSGAGSYDQTTDSQQGIHDGGMAAMIDNTAANKIADHVLRRNMATARVSADGDAVSVRSVMGATSKLHNKVDSTTNVGKITVFEEDDASQFYTQTFITNAAALPMDSIDTD